MTRHELNRGLLTILMFIFFTGSAFAGEALRIYPTKIDCGVIEEGVLATMLATVENIGTSEVRILNVRTN